MKYLSLSIPGYGEISPPPNIPSGAGAPSNVINTFLSLFLVLGIVFSVIFVAYGGILWVTSQGDKGKLDKARRTITFSIVGLIVMLLAFVIVRIVGSMLGTDAVANLGK